MVAKDSKQVVDRALLEALPKPDLHVHLDGSLRIETLLELAKQRSVKLPSRSPEGLRRLVFKRAYESLPEYLRGFEFTVACLQDAESLERAAYELALDCQAENCHYLEVRFAPQLHAYPGFGLREVLKAVARGLERARKTADRDPDVKRGIKPPFRCGIIVCAMRFFLPEFSQHYRAFFETMAHAKPEQIYAAASLELARAAVRAREEDGVPIVGLDLAGQERGFPAADHAGAYQLAHEHFLGKTVHAGEDYGPESIFQALTVCHADRIGHGTWLFRKSRIRDRSIQDRDRFVEELVRYVADRRITLEVCLTSNQQTLPEFREKLHLHPFRLMRRARVSTAICTDNRLVSRTTCTDEIAKAVETFKLTPREVKNILVYGFKRSFFPGSYTEKREYVRHVIDRIEALFAERGIDTRSGAESA